MKKLFEIIGKEYNYRRRLNRKLDWEINYYDRYLMAISDDNLFYLEYATNKEFQLI